MDPAKGGNRIASPGADRIIITAAAAAAAAAKAKADAAAAVAATAADTSVSMPVAGQVYISEVMFAGGGTLPQWIEIANGSRSEQVNLSGWTLKVENATAEADVSVGGSITFTMPEGTRIDPSGQNDTPSTVLVVTEQGRNNLDEGSKGAAQITQPLDGSTSGADFGGCDETSVFIIERYGVPNHIGTAGSDCCSCSESRCADNGSRNRSEESRCMLRRQPLMRQLRWHVKPRRMLWGTSVLLAQPHGYCRQTRVRVARLFVDMFLFLSVQRHPKPAI